jgi:hypothetical protein
MPGSGFGPSSELVALYGPACWLLVGYAGRRLRDADDKKAKVLRLDIKGRVSLEHHYRV